MTTLTDTQWQELKARAAQLGTSDGILAGEDFPLPDEATAARLLDGRHDAEFAPMHTEPLAGQFGRTRAWLYATLGVAPNDDTRDEALIRAYEDAYCNTAAMVTLRRAKLTADSGTRNSPHGYHKIRVVLTQTSNPYLAPRLPLAGELEVFEMNLLGQIMNSKAVFRAVQPNGSLGAPAEVRDIAFTYCAPAARYSDVHPSPGHEHTLREARTYAWARQDATGERDSDQADQFARTYADTWQAYRDQTIGRMTNLREAYTNWLRDRTIFQPHECAACGSSLGREPQPASDHAQPVGDPTQRRCQRCLSHQNNSPRPQ